MNPLDLPLSEIQAELARRSLARWSTYTNPGYQVAEFHTRLIAALERVERGECKRLMVQCPPRMGKTEAVSVNFPAWYLGRNPDKDIIMSSYGASLAYVNSRKARNLLQTFGRNVFGVEVADDSSAVDQWKIKDKRGGLAAVGVDGPATGKGADLFIVDDPVKDMADALSEVQRESKKQWYQFVARTRLHAGGSIVILQTRWHQDDLSGWLLNEARNGGEQWEVLSFPMENADGSLLWPERYDRTEVDAIKRAVGSSAWAALYQQNPVDDEGGMFKRHWWKRYQKLPHVIHEWIASMDCSFKKADTSDPTVIQVWARNHSNYYLVWQWRKRCEFTEARAMVKRTKELFPDIGRFYIEDTANGPAIISDLRNVMPGLIAVSPGAKGKPARAASVTPWVESGNVFIPESNQYAPVPWVWDESGDPVELFLNELSAFPKGRHDDCVDALSQGLNQFQSPVASAKIMGLPRKRAEVFDR